MNLGRESRRRTQIDLPLRSITGSIPEYFWISVASTQGNRLEPNRDRSRGASCSPAPGRFSVAEVKGSRPVKKIHGVNHIKMVVCFGVSGRADSP
jgi:hypothetical protein